MAPRPVGPDSWWSGGCSWRDLGGLGDVSGMCYVSYIYGVISARWFACVYLRRG